MTGSKLLSCLRGGDGISFPWNSATIVNSHLPKDDIQDVERQRRNNRRSRTSTYVVGLIAFGWEVQIRRSHQLVYYQFLERAFVVSDLFLDCFSIISPLSRNCYMSVPCACLCCSSSSICLLCPHPLSVVVSHACSYYS